MRRQQAGILALLEEADNMSPAVHRGYGQRRGQGLIVVRGEDDDAAGADNPGALQISRGGKAAGPYITDPPVAMRELIPRKKDELLRGRRVGHQLRSEEHTSEIQSIMRNSYAFLCLSKKNY